MRTIRLQKYMNGDPVVSAGRRDHAFPMRKLESVVLTVGLLSSGLSAQTITITNATLVDVSTGALRRGTTVVIDGNRIVSVGQSVPASASKGQTVDAKGMYLIPGLWDMHAHVYFDSSTAAIANEFILPSFLVNGVTGVRDMGSLLDDVVRGRDGVAAHRIVGPRLVVSGPMLTAPTSTTRRRSRSKHPTMAGRLSACSSAKASTSSRYNREFRTTRTSRLRRRRSGSGSRSKATFLMRSEQRTRSPPDSEASSTSSGFSRRARRTKTSICLANTSRAKDTSARKTVGMFLATSTRRVEKGIIQLLAKHQTWQCPDVFWERGQWLVDTVDYNKDPDLAYAPRSWVKQWAGARDVHSQSLDTDPLAVRRRFVAHELDLVRKLHAANVPFLAGTDTPAGVDVLPGISLHHELERFVAAGFTPLEALQTATLNPARYYGKLNDFGSIQPGRIADLVLLRANPLENIANTRSIVGVVADGHYFSRADIEQRRARLKQFAAAK